jgi:hypothetical protein
MSQGAGVTFPLLGTSQGKRAADEANPLLLVSLVFAPASAPRRNRTYNLVIERLLPGGRAAQAT